MCYQIMLPQTFYIEYQGENICITVQCVQDGDDVYYECFSNEPLGKIYPTCADDPCVIWKGDGMPEDLVKLIGNEIERQDW